MVQRVDGLRACGILNSELLPFGITLEITDLSLVKKETIL